MKIVIIVTSRGINGVTTISTVYEQVLLGLGCVIYDRLGIRLIESHQAIYINSALQFLKVRRRGMDERRIRVYPYKMNSKKVKRRDVHARRSDIRHTRTHN